MNIQTLLSQGNAVQLGPVTVEKTYEKKPGDKNRFLLISDTSGKGALKIWGAAANTELFNGQQITLIGSGPKGGLKTSEYNGKVSIDANDCRIEIAGQQSHQERPQASVEHVGFTPAPGASGYATGTRNAMRVKLAAPSAELDERDKLILEKHVKIVAHTFDLAMSAGLPGDLCEKVAANAPENYHLSWCGQKGLGDID